MLCVGGISTISPLRSERVKSMRWQEVIMEDKKAWKTRPMIVDEGIVDTVVEE